ncbi:armadillo-type protein [Zopfochytrium polystomum]|nr:armadillo-type protein [Zopfochytrium polystomum]
MRNLDGSIKKNTAFTKKLKTNLTADQLPTLTKELLSLKLEKYITEAAAAILESKLGKPADAWAAVEICSLLHQRFAEFTPALVPNLVKALGPPPNSAGMTPEQKEREEAARVPKQRGMLRLFTELYLVGIVVDPPNAKESVMATVVKDMFGSDKDFLNVSIAVSFAKGFGDAFWVAKSGDGEDQDWLNPESPVPPLVQRIVRSTFVEYFAGVSKYLVRMHKHIQKVEASNYEHAIARGEISEDRQERLEKGIKTYEKLLANAKVLSEHLGEQMPDLPDREKTAETGMGIIYGGRERQEIVGTKSDLPTGGVWEDEEARQFYEDIVDLKLFVPQILLGEAKEKASLFASEAQAEEAERAAAATSLDESDLKDDDEAKLMEDEEDDQPETKDALSGRAAVESILARLPNALAKDAIDQLSVEFCYNNSKPARKRLAKHLFTVSRQRTDLLPYYSRLIANLLPYIPEVGVKVVEALEKDFRSLLKRRDRVPMEERMKNVRFIAELTKFRVAPSHVPLHVLKVLIDDFSGSNIELLSLFLECCGRFLFKSPDTSARTGAMLEVMMRKKTVLNLDSRHVVLINNAFYQCNPPDTPTSVSKVREPLEMYIRQLLIRDLSRKSVDRITKKLRKMNWADRQVVGWIRKPFFKPWKLKSSNIPLLAYITCELGLFYPDFSTAVVDNCLEEVRWGLETNVFKDNHRRLASVRLLGELYNYRLLESDTIFDTLYLILRFGYASPVPEPGVSSPLDAPHDFFRVRLCCALLETCGPCFDRGRQAAQLDEFLAFIQVYLTAKTTVSMDIEFLLSETLELLRPKLSIMKSYEEAAHAFNTLISQRLDRAALPESASEAEGQDDVDDGDETKPRFDDYASDEEDGQANQNDSGAESGGEGVGGFEQEVVVHMPEEERNEEEDTAFELAFSRMMQESLSSGKSDRKTAAVFDVPIPGRVKFADAAENESAESDSVTFTLLTKKGNKQQFKRMALPKDSTFAVSTKIHQEEERVERMQLKRLVLSYEEREREGKTRSQRE